MTKEKYIKRIRDLYDLLRTNSGSSRQEIRTQVFWYAAGIREAMILISGVSLEDFDEICKVDVYRIMDGMEATYGI